VGSNLSVPTGRIATTPLPTCEALMTSPLRSNRHRSFGLPLLAVAGASILVAACGSSSKTSAPPVSNSAAPAAAPATTTGGASASNASVTVSAASVPGLGTVLVNGNGRPLYVLASEKGGKVTCTSTGGCTTIWPPLVLPSGMSQGIAGSGVQASLLGTVKSPAGDTRVTYGGWPLYTFSADSGSGAAKGQDVKDSYGLWWVLSPSGTPITTAPSSAAAGPSSPTTAPPTTTPQSGGAGF
jgi:predicted lipoprotein with Yx(FWY)xxD motif